MFQSSYDNATAAAKAVGAVPSTVILVGGKSSQTSVSTALTVANGTNPVNLGTPFLIPNTAVDKDVFITASCEFVLTGQPQVDLMLEAFVTYSGPAAPANASCGDATITSLTFGANDVDGSFPCSIVGAFTLNAGNSASIQLRASASVAPTSDTSISVSGVGAICFYQ